MPVSHCLICDTQSHEGVAYCGACTATLQESIETANREQRDKHSGRRAFYDDQVAATLPRFKNFLSTTPLVPVAQIASAMYQNPRFVSVDYLLSSGFSKVVASETSVGTQWRQGYAHDSEVLGLFFTASVFVKRFKPQNFTLNNLKKYISMVRAYLVGPDADAHRHCSSPVFFIFEQAVFHALWNAGYHANALAHFNQLFPSADCFQSASNENYVEYDFHGLDSMAYLACLRVLMAVSQYVGPQKSIHLVFGRNGTVLRAAIEACLLHNGFIDVSTNKSGISFEIDCQKYARPFFDMRQKYLNFQEVCHALQEEELRLREALVSESDAVLLEDRALAHLNRLAVATVKFSDYKAGYFFHATHENMRVLTDELFSVRTDAFMTAGYARRGYIAQQETFERKCREFFARFAQVESDAKKEKTAFVSLSHFRTPRVYLEYQENLLRKANEKLAAASLVDIVSSNEFQKFQTAQRMSFFSVESASRQAIMHSESRDVKLILSDQEIFLRAMHESNEAQSRALIVCSKEFQQFQVMHFFIAQAAGYGDLVLSEGCNKIELLMLQEMAVRNMLLAQFESARRNQAVAQANPADSFVCLATKHVRNSSSVLLVFHMMHCLFMLPRGFNQAFFGDEGVCSSSNTSRLLGLYASLYLFSWMAETTTRIPDRFWRNFNSTMIAGSAFFTLCAMQWCVSKHFISGVDAETALTPPSL